jgi:hypothetical protein
VRRRRRRQELLLISIDRSVGGWRLTTPVDC